MGIDPFLTIPALGSPHCSGFGFLLQKYVLNRVVAASVFLGLIITFGLDMVITNIHLALFPGHSCDSLSTVLLPSPAS